MRNFLFFILHFFQVKVSFWDGPSEWARLSVLSNEHVLKIGGADPGGCARFLQFPLLALKIAYMIDNCLPNKIRNY